MNSFQINRLAQIVPSATDVARRFGGQIDEGGFIPAGGEMLFTLPHSPQFYAAYERPDFGWIAASRLAAFHLDFPLQLTGNDHWVFKAWAALRFGIHHLSEEDGRALQHAWALAYSPKCLSRKQVLQALLLNEGSTCERVAAATAVPLPVVTAFEVLFFDVISRRDDLLFIRNLVYPQSRFTEMTEGYSARTDASVLLNRAAYQSDFDTTLFLAGFRPKDFLDNAAEVCSSQFQRSLLQVGAVMANSGMLWFDRQHATLAATRGFIQASKLAGEDLGDEDNFISLSQAFRQELGRVSAEMENEARVKAFGG